MKKKYNSKRPYIKASVVREIKLEARHRCMVCKETSALETHHIDGNRENNYIENLILLCAVCHKRADGGKITRKELLEYKRKAHSANAEIIALQKENENLKQLVENFKEQKLVLDKNIKAKFLNLLKDWENLLILYYSLIFLLEPFYIDSRGIENRKKIRGLLSLTKKEEAVFLEKLEKESFIKRTGGIMSIENKELAKQLLSNLIEKNQINLDKIMKLFN